MIPVGRHSWCEICRHRYPLSPSSEMLACRQKNTANIMLKNTVRLVAANLLLLSVRASLEGASEHAPHISVWATFPWWTCSCSFPIDSCRNSQRITAFCPGVMQVNTCLTAICWYILGQVRFHTQQSQFFDCLHCPISASRTEKQRAQPTELRGGVGHMARK